MGYEMVQYLSTNDNQLYANVEWLYDICRKILSEIPDTFSNYTIHDIDHSIRIIGYMNDIIKDRIGSYSCLHIAVLIYVALLHDTGMVVSEYEKKKLYAEFTIKYNHFKHLNEDEKKLFLQDYIRKNHGIRVHDVINLPIDDKGTLISSRLKIEDYDLADIIADICQAHMEDTEWIEKNLDDERTFGPYTFNPRHAAVLLRIGDALDIDARRAPYVLFNMLRIRGYSAGEWRKQIPITNYKKIYEDKNGELYIHFEGKCNDYDIYQKVDSYIDDVQSWLEKDLQVCTGNYQLNIRPQIDKDIKSDEFEKTELVFTLEYKQITKLLMGEKIYGSKKDGLRELLQNAIDAVLLMQNIKQNEAPHDIYSPMIGIEINKKEKTISIFDNGIGMSEDVLTQFFFNIGKSYYQSTEFNKIGYSYSPIGQFGIGFLACFMLSKKITLETKHYSEGSKLIKMSFDKESYNVIKYKNNKKPFDFQHGTRIIMDYEQIIPSVFPDIKEIEQYIKELLIDNKYTFKFCDSKDRDIKLKKLKKTYHSKEEREETEFDYEADVPNRLLLDVESFFDGYGKNNVYIIDKKNDIFQYEPGFPASVLHGSTPLNNFMSYCRELESKLQIKRSGAKEVLKDMPKDYDNFFKSYVQNYTSLIDEAFRRHRQIVPFFLKYLYKRFISNDELVWYDYPCIYHKDTFNKFVETYEKEGAQNALTKYAEYIEYISILNPKKEPSTKDVISIIDKHLINHAFGKGYEATSVSYYNEYPIKPIKHCIKILSMENSYRFIGINQDNDNLDIKLYLKGIRVRDNTISLPYMIMGINISSIIANFKSNRYGLDVSRNNFDATIRDEIANTIARAIYDDIKKRRALTSEEKELIDKFQKVYYDKKEMIE